jgi:uncharacterized protein YkwD
VRALTLSARAAAPVFAALVLAACVARAGAEPAAPAPPGPAASLVVAVNEERAAHGLAALRPDAQLARMAEAQARAMAEHDYFAHRGPNGEGLTARLAQFGYAYSFAAENLAGGPKDARETVAGWMQSPPHRRNLLAPEAVAIGTGYAFKPHDDGNAAYRTYWVLVVAAPAEP